MKKILIALLTLAVHNAADACTISASTYVANQGDSIGFTVQTDSSATRGVTQYGYQFYPENGYASFTDEVQECGSRRFAVWIEIKNGTKQDFCQTDPIEVACN